MQLATIQEERNTIETKERLKVFSKECSFRDDFDKKVDIVVKNQSPRIELISEFEKCLHKPLQSQRTYLTIDQ